MYNHIEPWKKYPVSLLLNIAELDKAYDKCHHLPFKSNETSHFYQMDQFIFVFSVVRCCFYAPAIYNGGGAYSITLVRTSVRTYVHTYVPYVRKMVSGRYLLNTLVYWIHISYTGIYKHKIQVKFDYGQNPPIIIRVMALDLRMQNGFRAISFEYIDVLDSYFIHRYIIIKYRSSSSMGKIHLLLSELWPLISV